MNIIKFYKVKNEYYGCFSNFSCHEFTYKGKRWKTSEHCFQAMKFEGTEHEERIRLLDKPREALNEGKRKDLPLREDWEKILGNTTLGETKVKDQFMYEIVLAKFAQNKNIRDILISTEDAIIIEDSPIDSYWGCGEDGNGLNMLGKILMRVREDLKRERYGKNCI